MENSSTNPIIIALLFLLRCLVPLAIMLGISFLLRRFGLIRETMPTEETQEEEDDSADEGGLIHGSV